MIEVSAYLRSDKSCLVCEQSLVRINSAGYYHFKTKDVGRILRSEGREDYQIIYIAKGKGYFTFDKKEVVIEEGNIIFYRPGECQQYRYDYKDQSQIYWIHFTGGKVEEYLRQLNFKEEWVYKIGFTSEIISLWENIITELQVKRIYHEEFGGVLMANLLTSVARNIYEEKNNVLTSHKAMQKVIEEMNLNSHQTTTVKEYAKKCNMSVCWFISSFKELTGMTPGQYMTHIKINKAKALLAASQLNVNEVAEIVGFQNAFYFSKTFKKITGICPRDWKG